MTSERADPPLLVADIGGTNARFALAAPGEDGALTLLNRQTFRAEDYEDIVDAAHAYLESWDGAAPAQGAFAVAGPTDVDEVRFTNSPWSFRRDALAAALSLNEFRVLNDFEAQARGVDRMDAAAVVVLKPGDGAANAPVAVFGPGTGLGLSLIAPSPTGPLALSTEGGHAAFSPQTDKEIEVLKFIREEHDYVSFERILSGRGLVNIHRALCVIAGATRVTLTPSEITEAALNKTLPVAAEAVDMFCAILGVYAGNVVLLTGARGGAVIAGGIAPKILPVLQKSAFVARFCERGPMSSYLDSVPVRALISDEAAFFGAASALSAASTQR